MGNVDFLNRWQFAQILQLDVVLWAIELDEVGKVREMIAIYADNSLVGDVGRHNLFGMLEVKHFEEEESIDLLFGHGFLS